MGKITGTGCQLSGIMTAYLTANPDSPLEAAAASVCMMGLPVRSGGAGCRKVMAMPPIGTGLLTLFIT